MAKELSVAPSSELSMLESLGIEAEYFGLRFTRKGLSIEDFEKAGRFLMSAYYCGNCSIKFKVGDWYNELNTEYGERKEQILDIWGEGMYHQILKWGYTARHIELPRRNKQLNNWALYDEIAPMDKDEQDKWMMMACSKDPVMRAAATVSRIREAKKLERQQKEQALITAKKQAEIHIELSGHTDAPSDYKSHNTSTGGQSSSGVSETCRGDDAPVVEPEFISYPHDRIPDTLWVRIENLARHNGCQTAVDWLERVVEGYEELDKS